jgi:hypothetical protein
VKSPSLLVFKTKKIDKTRQNGAAAASHRNEVPAKFLVEFSFAPNV